MRHPMALDQAGGQIPVPARHQHQCGAQINGRVHHRHHARDVKHGHHAQAHIVWRALAPKGRGHGVVHQALVQVNTALGQAGGATGVGQHGHVSGLDIGCGRGSLASQSVHPQMGLAHGQGGHGRLIEQPFTPCFGHVARRNRCGIKPVGVLCDQQMLQLLFTGQGITGLRQSLGQVSRRDGHAGIGVRNIVLQLQAAVHGVDWHHHRIRTQDGKVGHQPLRAVLHQQQYPVPGLHAIQSQPSGQAFGLAHQFEIGPSGAHELNSAFVGIPLGADGQVVPQGG